eukprot:TRINITY_DN25879_c0_g1_i1.p2 TRINITY_DN25879_c0_g1~~TRINITY_DN25879_c0_g1_i1.p2  ORF type:complete len:112 (-),score=33.00 TRINITY_DN25879_c0_g1_i1:161-496(-)
MEKAWNFRMEKVAIESKEPFSPPDKGHLFRTVVAKFVKGFMITSVYHKPDTSFQMRMEITAVDHAKAAGIAMMKCLVQQASGVIKYNQAPKGRLERKVEQAVQASAKRATK